MGNKMSGLSTKLRGWIIQQVVSRPDPTARARARRFGINNIRRKPPTLELYFEASDPHSHLALQALGKFAERLHCPVEVLLVPAPEASTYPEEEQQREFALVDAKRIASAWGLSFPANAARPDGERINRVNRLLVANSNNLYSLLKVTAEIRDYLFCNGDWPAQLDQLESKSRTVAELDRNASRRKTMGHYLPAMWQFDGEWFWGLDRFKHLVPKLMRWGVLEADYPLLPFSASKATLPELNGDSLEFYFSFRSPYSYLAAEYVLKNHQQWPVPVTVKPVLPMVMRGLPVPRAKRLYIVRDVKRCATQDGYPFGHIADPVGAGTERAITVFSLCKSTEQQLRFLAAAGRAAFAENKDLATDEGLLHATRTAGLDDAAVLAKLNQGIELSLAERNREDLRQAGLWGVPSWKVGNFSSWGYDRKWMHEELFRRAAE